MDIKKFIAFFQKDIALFSELTDMQIFSEIMPFINGINQIEGKTQELNQILKILSAHSNKFDPYKASHFATCMGIIIENGGQAAICAEYIMQLFNRNITLCERYLNLHEAELNDEKLFMQNPVEVKAHYGMKYLINATMAVLSRDIECRQKIRQNKELNQQVENLKKIHRGLNFIQQTLDLIDEAELIILDPTNKKGFLFKINNIKNIMYHCYALVQAAIVEKTGQGYLNAKPIDQAVLLYAQGIKNNKVVNKLSDELRFAFYTPAALTTNLSLSNDNKQLMSAYMWGSVAFTQMNKWKNIDIPTLLVGPILIYSSWNPVNMYPIFHDAIKPRAILVKELSQVEVMGRLKALIS